MEPLFNNGSYSIIYFLEKKIKIFIPKFGSKDFTPGFYVYSGSGKKNLLKRVERHLRKEKKLKWHIDYFSSQKVVTPKEIFLFKEKNECENNLFFKKIGGVIVIPGFGSSDCKDKCGTHFLYFNKMPRQQYLYIFE